MVSEQRVNALRAAARVSGRWFVVRRCVNQVGFACLLVRVAKQVLRSAVARNRIRRCVREVFRQERSRLPEFDYFVSLIRPYREASLEPARQELKRLLLS
ncbi:MAG: ribonuclease P protein component [Betaproteobacteria bacterium]|nr:MAG: ribonuclease P protein component [Betaproteobacteria bacterium]